MSPRHRIDLIGGPAARQVAVLDEQLRALGNPERAAAEKRYLKSELSFYGVSVGEIRSCEAAWAGPIRSLGPDQVVALAAALWDAPVHERRMATVVLLARSVAVLGVG